MKVRIKIIIVLILLSVIILVTWVNRPINKGVNNPNFYSPQERSEKKAVEENKKIDTSTINTDSMISEKLQIKNTYKKETEEVSINTSTQDLNNTTDSAIEQTDEEETNSQEVSEEEVVEVVEEAVQEEPVVEEIVSSSAEPEETQQEVVSDFPKAVIVNTQVLKVRINPGYEATPIGVICVGDEIQVEEEVNGWYRFWFSKKDITGWIPKEYVIDK